MTQLSLSLLRTTLARLHCACDAIGIKADDVRLSDFTAYDQERWEQMADEDIRQFINEDSTPYQELRK